MSNLKKLMTSAADIFTSHFLYRLVDLHDSNCLIARYGLELYQYHVSPIIKKSQFRLWSWLYMKPIS